MIAFRVTARTADGRYTYKAIATSSVDAHSSAIDRFGPHRVMFGSDWPVCLLATSLNHWIQILDELTGSMSPDERAKLFADNARRIYRLN